MVHVAVVFLLAVVCGDIIMHVLVTEATFL